MNGKIQKCDKDKNIYKRMKRQEGNKKKKETKDDGKIE